MFISVPVLISASIPSHKFNLALQSNIRVTEAQINPDILYEADEVFLTNATKGIQWVMGYGVKRYFNKLSKFLMDELNKL